MRGIVGFIAVIFLISLSVGLIHYYQCNATEKENPTEMLDIDSTMTLEPDTIAEQDLIYKYKIQNK